MSANFNSGWYLVFKGVLVFYVIALIYNSFKNLTTGNGFSNSAFTYLLNIIVPLVPAAIMGVQFIAMHKRDLMKAKTALICFGVLTGFALYGTISVILSSISWSQKFSLFFLDLLGSVIMCAITFGSFQVYKAMKPSGASNGDLIKGILSA